METCDLGSRSFCVALASGHEYSCCCIARPANHQRYIINIGVAINQNLLLDDAQGDLNDWRYFNNSVSSGGALLLSLGLPRRQHYRRFVMIDVAVADQETGVRTIYSGILKIVAVKIRLFVKSGS